MNPGTTGRFRFVLFCIFIFMASVSVRVYRAATIDGYIQPPYGESDFIAKSLAAGHGFANPYIIPTGPTAHTAPAYPALQAIVLALFGGGPAFGFVLTAIAMCATSLNWALMPILAARFDLPPASGFLAGIGGAFYPLGVDVDGSWEAPLAIVALTGLLIATLAMRRRMRERPGGSRFSPTVVFVLFGAAWGAAILMQPILGLVGVIACVTLFVDAYRSDHRRFAWQILWTLAPVILFVTPWMIRNRVVLGMWAPIRDNLGLELRVSNHENALPLLTENESSLPGELALHPERSHAEALRVLTLGEAAYSKACWNDFRVWSSQHRAEFARLTLARTRLFWLPPRRSRLLPVIDFLTLVSAAAGLVWLLRRNPFGGVLIAIIWLLYPLIYYLVQASERYSYPLRGTIVIMACVVPALILEHLLRRQRSSGEKAGPPMVKQEV